MAGVFLLLFPFSQNKPYLKTPIFSFPIFFTKRKTWILILFQTRPVFMRDFKVEHMFLVRDGLYTHRCLSFFHSFCPPFSESSTKPLLRPAWRLVLISCLIQTRCTANIQCTEAGLNSGATVPSKVCALQCVHHQSWQKRRSSLNLARIEKCQKRRWHYFSMLRGSVF